MWKISDLSLSWKNFLHTEGVTPGASEEIYEVTRTVSSIGWDEMGEFGDRAGVYGTGFAAGSFTEIEVRKIEMSLKRT